MPPPPSAAPFAPKVLIVAPNASSQFGGEAYIPLQYFRALQARGHPVRMITHARNRANLSEVLAGALGDITFIDDTAVHRLLHRWSARHDHVLVRTACGAAMAAVDSVLQAAAIRRLVRAEQPLLIHQPTPVSPLAPSRLHRFGLPLIIGPMNGGMHYPPGYDDLESPRARQFVAWARRLAWLLNRLFAGKRRAAVLLVANDRTRDALPFRDHVCIRMLVENGVDAAALGAAAQPTDRAGEPPGRLRLAYLGRLVDWKMVDTTLHAVRLALSRGMEVTIDIIGDGPEHERLVKLAGKFDLTAAVRFHGFKPQAECVRLLAQADALILNSVRECGGAVVLEAMALGLPVIASDWGGPADYLDDECGILVSPVPRATFAPRLADAIVDLAESPGKRMAMGRAGRRKVERDYRWSRKVDTMVDLYREVAHA